MANHKMTDSIINLEQHRRLRDVRAKFAAAERRRAEAERIALDEIVSRHVTAAFHEAAQTVAVHDPNQLATHFIRNFEEALERSLIRHRS